jgi:hypothetical protein
LLGAHTTIFKSQPLEKIKENAKSFLKGVAVPFLMFRMNECCDGMDAKEQLYTAGGF